ncbi:MAG: hypothetical protein Q4D13_02015 [Erysipelotrichaceae bacterium]|nr:hypothetical protein [Erysipelotrichaceae bacterium]
MNNDIENSVRLVVEDLKKKIDDMEEAANSANSNQAVEIKDKAVEVLKRVSGKFVDTARDVRNSKEFNDGMEFVLNKSKELYETTMKKIEEVSEKAEVKETFSNITESIDNAVNEIKNTPVVEEAGKNISSLFEEVKKNVEEIQNSEEVKQKIDNAKKVTVEVAEKGLDILKEWLSPEGENK